MLLIVAPRHDMGALWLASRWQSDGAVLVTGEDVCAPGWTVEVPSRAPSRFIAGGNAMNSEQVSGVITRISGAEDLNLDHIALEDRSYVEAELNAFLLAWLSSLKCPILNRPRPGCLCGPNWRTEKWIHVAGRLGIPVEPVRRSTTSRTPNEPGATVTVTVAGERCIGSVHSNLAENSRRLAAAAGAGLLEVRFTDADAAARLCGVSLCCDVADSEVADALREHFDARSGAA